MSGVTVSGVMVSVVMVSVVMVSVVMVSGVTAVTQRKAPTAELVSPEARPLEIRRASVVLVVDLLYVLQCTSEVRSRLVLVEEIRTTVWKKGFQ